LRILNVAFSPANPITFDHEVHVERQCRETFVFSLRPFTLSLSAVALPLRYNIRNVVVRWRATLATVLGVGLVVAVYVSVQALAVGLEKASASTGDPRNLMIVRRGSAAESGSQITREQFRLIQYAPEISR